MATNGRTIKLQSNEGDIFDVDAAALQQSGVLKDYSENEQDDAVPLPNVNSAVLKKLLEYMDYHKNDPVISNSVDDENREKNSDDMSAWDRDFLKIDTGFLFELILAANYLDMKHLLNLTCKKVADTIRGQSPDTIRRTFNIKTTFTPEEEEKIKKEDELCEEE